MKRCSFANEKALTLVEVLAALVILGIFFTGVLTILPQMTLFNAKTETKLDTMNLARQEMAIILKEDAWKKQLETSTTDPTSLEPDFLTPARIQTAMQNRGYHKDVEGSMDDEPLSSSSFMRYEKSADYHYVADVYLQCQPFLAANQTSGGSLNLEPCHMRDTIKLHKLHLRLYSRNGAEGNVQLSSETYSFIPYTALPPLVVSGGD